MTPKGTLLAIVFLLLSACKGESEQDRAAPAAEPATAEVEAQPAASNVQETSYPEAPDFALLDLEGNTHRLSDYRGKVVILDFWATYCPPCKKEIPHFNDLLDEYGDQGLVVLGITLDGEQKARNFLKNFEVKYPVLLPDGQVVAKFGGVKFIPTTFVITPDGGIAHKYIGYRSKETFLSAIKPYLTGE